MDILENNSQLSFYWINDNAQIHKLLSGELTVDKICLGECAPFLEMNDILNDRMETIIARVLLWEENNECRGVICMKHKDKSYTPPFVVSISVGGSDLAQLRVLDETCQITRVGIGTSADGHDIISLQILSRLVQRHVLMQYSSIKTSFPKMASSAN